MTTDHEGDEVFERLQEEHHALVDNLAASLDLDAGVKDALDRRVEPGAYDPDEREQALNDLGDAMNQALTCGATSTEWLAIIDSAWREGFAAGRRFQTGITFLARVADSSPDPDGAEATVLAPDSDTATEATDD